MRIVSEPVQFQEQMQRAVSEAKNSFGDDAVFVEKFISSPKHIEVQILGDQHGNILYLHERECSIQRRNQKVIEEAPSAVLSPEQRKAIGEAAVNVAKACNYHGAGTVEFIADEQLNFYFLEMNTRLQVEHPVTEQITGIDLVKEQIKVAEGQKLVMLQEEVPLIGHSIEARVYAEDPENGFLPDTGTLITYRRPQGVGIRVDDGYEEGMEIPIYYDPMIAKLIVYASSREEAIDRMKRAISEYRIEGIKTTLPFCHFVMDHQKFRDGSFTTKFVEEEYTSEKLKKEIAEEIQEVAALFALEYHEETSMTSIVSTSNEKNPSPWRRRLNHR